MKPLENRLVWSVSRANNLNFCARRYYYTYYQSWGGWERSARDEARLAYILKNRQTIPGWVGDKTHQAIEYWLKRPAPDKQAIREQVCREMDREFDLSRRKTYLSPYGRRKDFGLLEHYRGEEISGSTLEQTKDRVSANLEAFLNSRFAPMIEEAKRSPASRLLMVDDRDDFENMKFRVTCLDDLEIFASPDLCLEPAPGEYLVVDWKTGERRAEENRLTDQLRVQALRLREERSIDPAEKKVEAFEVYLPECREVGGRVTPGDLDEIVETIRDDLARMKSYLADEAGNIPGEKERFTQTEDEHRCDACSFAELCEARA